MRSDRALLCNRELRLHRVRDFRGNFAFARKDVSQSTVILFCPKMGVVLSVDELNVDSHLISGFLHRAFEDMCDTESRRDFRKVGRSASVALCRSTRDYFQIRDL